MAEAGLGFRRTGRMVYHKAAKGVKLCGSWDPDRDHSCPINSNTARIAFLSCNRRLNPRRNRHIARVYRPIAIPFPSFQPVSHFGGCRPTYIGASLFLHSYIPSFHCQFSVGFPLQFQSTYSPSWAAVANSKVIPPKMTQRFSRLLPRKCIPFCSGIHGTDTQGHSLTLRLPNLL